MNEPKRKLPWERGAAELLLEREWLVTNGLGGYASGTVARAPTRRYHGLLVAALPAPQGRVVVLDHLAEQVELSPGLLVPLGGGEERASRDLLLRVESLEEFRLDLGLPVWRARLGELVIEKELVLPHMQNTVHVIYRLVHGAGPVRLHVRPSLHMRPHDGPVSGECPTDYAIHVIGDRCEVRPARDLPVLRVQMRGAGAALTLDGGASRELYYRAEADRGYDARGMLWSPGHFSVSLYPGRAIGFIASTEPWSTVLALEPEEALQLERERRRQLVLRAQRGPSDGVIGELVLAADQFIVAPLGRTEDVARARAAGDEVRTVIAGYHWFTDWGRDTMISLEGLCLVTGRHTEARWILKTFANAVREGLIPNLFPEHERQGLYHTADASLWFFHAVERYVAYTGDEHTLRLLLPKLVEIAEAYLRGTRFNIGVDPEDGLVRQGAPGLQLTWMDAKVDDWVVTPRRGKPVEINALWFNALQLLAGWMHETGDEAAAQRYLQAAQRARDAFNARFWSEARGHLLDVVDGELGDDGACRPNQLFAMSLRHPVLDEARWEKVLEVVRAQLLTPVGLRSLAPGHPDYKPQYFGDLRARDAAYHQGTVWAYLIGHFVDAWLRVHPDDYVRARSFLHGFVAHLDEACIGSISEVFDAEAPFTPRGCIAQAWSVAEVLRAFARTSPPTPVGP